jgi:hypothetical protein
MLFFFYFLKNNLNIFVNFLLIHMHKTTSKDFKLKKDCLAQLQYLFWTDRPAKPNIFLYSSAKNPVGFHMKSYISGSIFHHSFKSHHKLLMILRF